MKEEAAITLAKEFLRRRGCGAWRPLAAASDKGRWIVAFEFPGFEGVIQPGYVRVSVNERSRAVEVISL